MFWHVRRGLELERLRIGRDYYERLKGLVDAIRSMRHDYRAQLGTIEQLILRNKPEEALKFIGEIKNDTPGIDWTFFCSNPVIQALLDQFSTVCKRENTRFNSYISVEISEEETSELALILRRLLDHALEISKTAGGDKYINLSIVESAAGTAVMLKIRCAESYGGKRENMLIRCFVSSCGGDYSWKKDGRELGVYVLMKPVTAGPAQSAKTPE